MFPEPILSSADVVQHILEFVVVKRLPSVLCKKAGLQELDLLPEKIALTVPFVYGKIAHLLRVRVAELASARCNCVLRYFLPKH